MRKNLSILHISHISNYTPPVGYGGIELVVDLLARYQKRKGHNVKVLGVKFPGLRAEYPIISLFSRPVKRPRLYHKFYTIIRSFINSFDAEVIHLHVQWLAPTMPILNLSGKVALLTLHADLKNNLANSVLRTFKMPLIAISHSQKKRLEDKGLRVFDVAYHGIEINKYPLSREKEEYLVYLGRIDPSKGVHVAIRVSRKAGQKLILMGPITDTSYFDNQIRPFLDDRTIIYLGEVNFETKVRVLSHAKALVYPVQYEEFFGLAVVEALACGTPVIGFAKGSLVELIKHGITGFTVKTEDEIIKAIKEISSIDPLICRKLVEEKFSVESMVEKYEEIYIKLLEGID